MNNIEKEVGIERKPNFRNLVKDLLTESNLFQVSSPRATLGGEYTETEKQAMEKERTEIIEAIEKNDLSFYIEKNFSKNPSNKVIDAVHCLTTIHDELEKESPDENFISDTVEQLKEYL